MGILFLGIGTHLVKDLCESLFKRSLIRVTFFLLIVLFKFGALSQIIRIQIAPQFFQHLMLLSLIFEGLYHLFVQFH